MAENIPSINSATQGYYNPRVSVEFAKNLNLVESNKPVLNSAPDTSFVTNQDVSKIARDLANKFGIPDSVALRVVRKFLTAGSVPNLKALEDYVRVQIQGDRPDLKPNARKEVDRSNQNQIAKSRADNLNQAASLRPLLKEIKVNLNRDKTAEIKREVDNLFARKSDPNLQQIPNSRIPVTKLVSSPQAFASWLVNNKSAFIVLKANPQVTNLLTALQNPIINSSPILLAQITALVAQILRMKLGKQEIDSLDETEIEERQQAAILSATNKEHSIVGGLKEVSETDEVESVKSFLLEAERFAEEEVANLWSLTLKKEREIEKKLKAGLKSMKKSKQ